MSSDIEDIKVQLKTLDEADPNFPLRRAVASFLFMVMPIDGESHPKEFDRLLRILSEEYDLSDDATLSLIKHVRENQITSEEMEETANILKAGFQKSELLTLVSHMWEMVFADGLMHESEIDLVERVAHLLDISSEEVSKLMVT